MSAGQRFSLRNLFSGQPVNRLVMGGFLLVSIIPVLFLVVSLHRAVWDEAMDDANEKHRLLAESLAFPVRMYVDNHRAVLDTLSHHLSELNSKGDLEEAEHWFQDQIGVFTGLISLTWVDEQGRALVHLDNQGSSSVAAMVFANEETFLRARSTKTWAISGTRPSPIANRPVFLLAHPIVTYKGAFLGVLMAELNTGIVEALRHKISFGKGGYATLVDERGRVIAHPNFDWVTSMRDLSQSQAVQSALSGKTGAGLFSAPGENQEMIVGYAPVPGLNWGVLVQQPKSEIDAQVWALMYSQLLWAGLGLGLAVIFGISLARWITRPVNILAQAATRLVDNNFNGDVPELPTAAPREIGALADAVRATIKGLQTSRLEIGKFNYTLQQRVGEATVQLRESNARLKDAVDDARRANEAKSTFLASMSHEIRTPMNGVLGMTELLLQSGLNEKQKGFAAKVRRSAESLLTIINDILDLSKIEAGKFKLQHYDFDLREIVEDKIDLLAQSAHAAGLSVVCHIPEGVPTRVRGDATRLCQVLTNLVGNAIKFTEHGEIVVRAEMQDETNRYVLYRFTVKDTGVGIPPEVQAHMFESFAQGDHSARRNPNGTGLGLAIAKHLVMLMAGDIGLHSEQGVGTEFWFTVRFEKQQKNGSTDTIKPAAVCEQLEGMRVLVADRAPAQRQVLEQQLLALKLRPSIAANVADMVRALVEASDSNEPFELLMLDANVGDIPIGELVAMIKGDARITPLQIVLLTVPNLSDDQRAAFESVAAQLDKPLRQSQLYDTIASVMKDNRVACVPVTQVSQQESHTMEPLTGHVLLAEDNIVNTEVAKEMLSVIGITVEHVENGIGVLHALERDRYDAILMDCQMPDMDGLEATRRVREKEKAGANFRRQGAGRLPIVALTANAMEGDRELCLAAGMDDYLTKPFNQSQLHQLLRKWLPVKPVPQTVAPATAPTESAKSEHKSSPQHKEAYVAAPLDNAALERLRALQRDSHTNVMERIIRLYFKDSAEALRRLKEQNGMAIADIAKLAHRWKSSCANVGAMQLAERLKKLEVASRAGSHDEINALLRDIEQEYNRVQGALSAQLEQK